MASSEIGPGPQRSPKAALAAVALGILLVGLSFVPALAGQRERWTKEQASAYQDASMKIQQLTHDLGSQSPDTASRAKEAEFQQAIDRFQDLRTELSEARADRGWAKMALRVIGGALGIAGIAHYFAQKREPK